MVRCSKGGLEGLIAAVHAATAVLLGCALTVAGVSLCVPRGAAWRRPSGHRPRAVPAVNAGNRLTACGSAMSAGYLPDGLRGWKQNSSGYTYFVYDGAEPVAETGQHRHRHRGQHLRRQRPALPACQPGHHVFYTFDPQGTRGPAPRCSTGSVLSSHMFDAYGLNASSPAHQRAVRLRRAVRGPDGPRERAGADGAPLLRPAPGPLPDAGPQRLRGRG